MTLSYLRERLRQSFLVTPLIGMLVAAVSAYLVAGVDQTLSAEEDLADVLNPYAEPSKTVIAAVGPAMLTFLGVVFSITLVALQMSAGQLSPRITRLFVRSRVTKATLTVCIATYVFTLIAQYLSIRAHPDAPDYVPLVAGVLTMALVLVSVVMFVWYVHNTLRLMRLTQVVEQITAETMRTVALLRPRGADEPPASPSPAAEDQVVRLEEYYGVIRGVNLSRLRWLAARHGAVIRLEAKVGDFVGPGATLAVVSGGGRVRARAVRAALDLGPERSMYQDVSFGLRQLVDIAIRALSPAVNDPTSAVQVLDRLQVICAALSRRELGVTCLRDRAGTVRIVQPLPDWEPLVDLAFSEILQYGAASAQVTRRIAAALRDLLDQVEEDRRPVLRKNLAYLRTAVGAAVSDPEHRVFALSPNRQGIG